MVGFFFTFNWFLLSIFGLKVEELGFSLYPFFFMTIASLFIALNPRFFYSLKIRKQAYDVIKRVCSRKNHSKLGKEREELRQLKGEKIFFETAKLIPKGTAVMEDEMAVHYNLARAYALFNKPEKALFHLHKVIESNYVSLAKIQNDDDFSSLDLSQEILDS